VSKKRILIVEDEPDVGSQIAQRLAAQGFSAEVVGDGTKALEIFQESPPHLVILDVMLPGADGYEVAQTIRHSGSQTSIIMLTARDDEMDQVKGLNAGADYYLTKPFSPRVLIATIEAAFRREERIKREKELAVDIPTIEVGSLKIDHMNHRVYIAGEEKKLTPTEFQLLEVLVTHQNEVMTRQKLLQLVWDWLGDVSDTRTVDVHIRSLRAKLNKDVIRTVHGIGYAFNPNGV
jgi:DNA-binding response OmpR family regulator